MKYNSDIRVRLISFIIILFSLFVIIRLYQLQIINHELYTDKADRQYSSSQLKLFSRGTIYFQNKDETLVSAASLKTGFTLAINPQLIKNSESVYEKLQTIMPVPRDVFFEKVSKVNDPYEELAKRVDFNIGEKIQGLNIPGVQIFKDRWRYYPAQSLASHTVGFMAYKGDDFAGRYGLESFYESTLRRNQKTYTNFFAQIFSDISNTVTDEQEGDVVTSIEPHVQSFFEDELHKVNEKYNSLYTAGIIIDPRQGNIIAMAVDPSFDLNNTRKETDISIFSNPLVENVYELGSVIKPLTVAAGIDAGVITPETTYYDPGFIVVNKKKISNFDGKERGIVTMQQALSESLNVGMAHIVSQLGNKKMTDYFYAFGLKQKTNIDLPNEAKNIVANLDSTRDIEHVTASFGQGIALTPVSAARSLSIIANGGYLITPHVADYIQYTSGLKKQIEYPVATRVLQQETAETVTRMMVKSVDQYLQGGKFKNERYSVAIKTGTAQIAENGAYDENDFLHSFVGFAPAFNPRFLVFIYTVKPQGVQYGSESLSQTFFDTINFLLNYYEIPPDR